MLSLSVCEREFNLKVVEQAVGTENQDPLYSNKNKDAV